MYKNNKFNLILYKESGFKKILLQLLVQGKAGKILQNFQEKRIILKRV